MNIAANVKQLFIGFNSDGFKCSLKKRSYPIVLDVEVSGIAVGCFSYKMRDAFVTDLLQQQMEMIRHKTEAKNLCKIVSRLFFEQNFPLSRKFFIGGSVMSKGLNKMLVLSFYREDISLFYPPIKNMIDFIGNQLWVSSWHSLDYKPFVHSRSGHLIDI